MSSRPNFFVALRLTSKPLIDSVSKIQSGLVSREPKLSASIVKPSKLHLTFFVMHIVSREHIEKATLLVNNCQSAVDEFFPDYPSTISFRNFGNFGKKVLFLSVENGPTLDKLEQLGKYMYDKFLEAGLVPSVGYEFVPHVTIAKTSADKKNKKLSILPSHFAGLESELDGNPVVLECIDLLAMTQQDEDGYYKSYGKLLFRKKEYYNVSQDSDSTAEMSILDTTCPDRVPVSEFAVIEDSKNEYISIFNQNEINQNVVIKDMEMIQNYIKDMDLKYVTDMSNDHIEGCYLNSNFQRNYLKESSINSFFEILFRLKELSDGTGDNKIQSIVHELIQDHQNNFDRYSQQEIITSALLFGLLIRYEFIHSVQLSVSLRLVIDGLHYNPESVNQHDRNSFLFGKIALEQFSNRLSEWPQYSVELMACEYLKQHANALWIAIKMSHEEYSNRNHVNNDIHDNNNIESTSLPVPPLSKSSMSSRRHRSSRPRR